MVGWYESDVRVARACMICMLGDQMTFSYMNKRPSRKICGHHTAYRREDFEFVGERVYVMHGKLSVGDAYVPLARSVNSNVLLRLSGKVDLNSMIGKPSFHVTEALFTAGPH